MKKCDFVKGPVSHEHLKDSALYQVLYSKYSSMVYSKLQCSKVTTLVRCHTYNLETEAYFSTLRNFCQTEQFKFSVFFVITASKFTKMALTVKTLQFGMNRVVSNEMFWYSAGTFNVNCEQALSQNNFFCFVGYWI